MKTQHFLTLFALGCFMVFSCVRSEKALSIYEEQEPALSGEAAFLAQGKKLNNPYTFKNMQISLQNLKDRGLLKPRQFRRSGGGGMVLR